MRSKDWSTFLPIPEDKTSDQANALDPGWLEARGVYGGSPTVLRLLRDEVLPLIRYLERERGLSSFHFLVHDRMSGVPTDEKDKGSYVHLRLLFKKSIGLHLEKFPHFVMTHAIMDPRPTAGGVDGGLLKNAEMAWRLIDMQSAWVLAFIEAHQWKDDGDIVRQMRQYLHYFANMTQMKLVG